MKFPKPHTIEQIASIIGCKFIGDKNFPVLGINEIHVVSEGDIVFVDHPKYYNKALSCAATTILIDKEVECPKGKTLLISDDPFRDFNKLTTYFKPFIASTTSIDPKTKIGKGTAERPILANQPRPMIFWDSKPGDLPGCSPSYKCGVPACRSFSSHASLNRHVTVSFTGCSLPALGL